MPIELPPGYRPIRLGGPYIHHNGRLYARVHQGRVQIGFRVLPIHINPLGMCHGGMLATLADMLIPCVVLGEGRGEPRFLPTINLSVDYLAGAPLGAWVEGEAEVLRTTQRLLFGQGVCRIEGEAVLRVSGVYKLGPPSPEGMDPADPLGLKGPPPGGAP